MKLPFSFSLQFAFRLLLPGAILAAALFPLAEALVNALRQAIAPGVVFGTTTLLAGWLIVTLDMPIYILLEGRRYWPRWLRDQMIVSERRRLCRLLGRVRKYRHVRGRHHPTRKDLAHAERRYLEASVLIRQFPLDKRDHWDPESPTRLGNLIAAFEQYPGVAYGMDAVFYWPRIWVMLDSNLRGEIDNQQAVADSGVYLTVVLAASAVLGLAYLGARQLGIHPICAVLPSTRVLLWLVPACALGSWLVYRTTLYVNAQFGELFKAVFDQYQEQVALGPALAEIARITGIGDSLPRWRSERYRLVWRYLQNRRVIRHGEPISPARLKSLR